MENNELQISPTQPPDAEQKQIPSPPKSSFMRRLVKWGAWFVAVVVFILASIALALQTYFPAERLRPILEKELAKALKQPVAIAGLEIGLLRGIEIRDVQIGKTPLLKVRALILDYDVSSLLLGTILINRIEIDNPILSLVSTEGKWNFQVPTEPGKKQAAPVPAKKAKPAVESPFPLPLEVDLKHFFIKNIAVNIAIDDQIQAHVAGLDINAQARLSQEDLNLEATLTQSLKNSADQHNLLFNTQSGSGLDVKTAIQASIRVSAGDAKHIAVTGKIQAENNQVKIGDRVLAPDLGLEWDMDLSLHPELLKVKTLALRFGRDNQIKLLGEINNFTSQPDFKLNIQEAAFNLKEISELSGNTLDLARLDGILKLSGLEMRGHLRDHQPELIDIAGGKITLDNFNASHASAQIDDARLDLDLQSIKLENLVLRQASAQADLSANKMLFKNLSVSKFTQQLKLETEGSDPMVGKLAFSTLVGNVEYLHPKLGKMGSSLRVEGTAEGDVAAGDLLAKVKLGAGNFLNATLRGTMRDFGKKDFQLDPSLTLDIDALLRALPAGTTKSTGRGIGEFNVHVQGTVDDKLQPVLAKAKADIALKGVDLQMIDPAISVNGLTAQMAFPLEYNPEKGVKVATIDLKTQIEKVKAPGKWEVGSVESQGRVATQQFLSLTKDPGIVPLTYNSMTKVGLISAAQPEVKLAGVVFGVGARGALVPADKNFRNLALSGDLSFENIEGLQKFKAGKSRTAVTVDIHDRVSSDAKINVKTNILAASVKHEGADFALGEVMLDSSARLNQEKGNVDVDWIKLDIPALANVDIKAQARKWGETFSAQGKISELQLGALWKTLPSAPANVNLAGKGSLEFSAKGSKPGEEALKNFKIPIEAHALLKIHDVSLTGSGSASDQAKPASFLEPLKIEGLSYLTEIDLKNNNLKATGKLIFGKVFQKELLGDAWLQPELEYQYAMTDWNRWVFEKHEFSIKNRGITHSLRGRVEGLKPFITQKAVMTPAEIASKLDIALLSSMNFKMEQPLSIGKNLKADGSLSSRQSFTVVPGKEIVFDGEVGFDKFNMSLEPDLKVNGVTGRFPFAKRFLLDKKSADTLNAENNAVPQKGFFSQLRNFSANKNLLRVDSLSYGSYKASNVGADFLYKGNQLAIEKFIFDALKGSVGGQLFLTQSPKGPVLNFSTEFAGIDFDDLMGRKSASGGAKSQMDGNMQFGFKVKQGTAGEKIAIDQIDLKIAITRIGEEALDRILMFIDPEESKPAIVDTRAKLKLAKPHRLSIVLENGNLSLEIWLKSDLLGGIVKAPELKRVPVSSLKAFRQLSEQLQVLAALRDVLQYLAAQGVEFDSETGMRLF